MCNNLLTKTTEYCLCLGLPRQGRSPYPAIIILLFVCDCVGDLRVGDRCKTTYREVSTSGIKSARRVIRKFESRCLYAEIKVEFEQKCNQIAIKIYKLFPLRYHSHSARYCNVNFYQIRATNNCETISGIKLSNCRAINEHEGSISGNVSGVYDLF